MTQKDCRIAIHTWKLKSPPLRCSTVAALLSMASAPWLPSWSSSSSSGSTVPTTSSKVSWGCSKIVLGQTPKKVEHRTFPTMEKIKSLLFAGYKLNLQHPRNLLNCFINNFFMLERIMNIIAGFISTLKYVNMFKVSISLFIITASQAIDWDQALNWVP